MSTKTIEMPIAEDLAVCPLCGGDGWDVCPDRPCALGCIRLYEATLIPDGGGNYMVADYEGPTVVTRLDAQAWHELGALTGIGTRLDTRLITRPLESD
jgi:hypothetical protein